MLVLLDENGGADFTLVDNNNMNALHHAAQHGRRNNISIILDSKEPPKIDSKDRAGNTSLMLAAKNGHTSTVDRLLDLKADTSVHNRYPKTALILALENNHVDVAKRLLEEKDVKVCYCARKSDKNQEITLTLRKLKDDFSKKKLALANCDFSSVEGIERAQSDPNYKSPTRLASDQKKLAAYRAEKENDSKTKTSSFHFFKNLWFSRKSDPPKPEEGKKYPGEDAVGVDAADANALDKSQTDSRDEVKVSSLGSGQSLQMLSNVLLSPTTRSVVSMSGVSTREPSRDSSIDPSRANLNRTISQSPSARSLGDKANVVTGMKIANTSFRLDPDKDASKTGGRRGGNKSCPNALGKFERKKSGSRIVKLFPPKSRSGPLEVIPQSEPETPATTSNKSNAETLGNSA